MRREDPILVSLRQADCILALANRGVGPRGVRSALRGGVGGRSAELADDDIASAIDQLSALRAIADAETRRIVAFAIDTRGCVCARSVREVAAIAGVPPSTARRKLRQGLDAVRTAFEERDRIAA